MLFPAKFFASAKDAATRTEVCKLCEHKALAMCVKCGCFIPSKVRFAQTACPEGKWSAVDGVDVMPPRNEE